MHLAWTACWCLWAAASSGGVTVGLEDPSSGEIRFRDGVLAFTGGAFVESGSEYLRADSIVWDEKNGRLRAKGDVMLSAPPLTFFCDSADYDPKKRAGVLRGVEVFRRFERKPGEKGRLEKGEIDVAVLRAETVEKRGDRFTAGNLSVTTCGMDPPHYEVKAAGGSFDAASGVVRLRECRLMWGGRTLLKYGFLECPVEDLGKMVFPRLKGGRRGDWGWWFSAGVRSSFEGGYDEPSVIYRDRRGPGFEYLRRDGGLKLRFSGIYESAVSDQDDLARALENLSRTAPVLDGTPPYVFLEDYLYRRRRLLDTVGVPSVSPETYGDTFRFGLEMSWEGESGPWSQSIRFDVVSDRNYLYEYERGRFYGEWERQNFMAAEKWTGWAFQEVVLKPNLEGFREETEYLPEWRLMTLPFRLPGGVDVEFAARDGFVRHTFDEAEAREGFGAFRSHSSVKAVRRVDVGPGMVVAPFVEGRWTWYSDSRSGGEAVQAGAGYGVRLGLCMSGTFAGGVLHVVRPVVSYERVPSTLADPLELFDFDEVEDFASGEEVELRLSQSWWRRKGPGMEPLGYLDVETRMYLSPWRRAELNSGNLWAPLRVRAGFNGWRGVSGLLDAVVGFYGEGLLDVYARVDVDRGLLAGDDGLAGFYGAFGMLAGDAAAGVLPERRAEGGFSYRAGRYYVEWGMGYEFEDNSMVERGEIYNRLRITRDFHDVRFSLSVRYGWEDGETRVGLSLEPSGYTAPPGTVEAFPEDAP